MGKAINRRLLLIEDYPERLISLEDFLKELEMDN